MVCVKCVIFILKSKVDFNNRDNLSGMNLSENMTALEHDYLIEVLISVEGIAEPSAEKIAGLKQRFPDFNDVQLHELNNIRNIRSRPAVLEKLREIDFRRPVEEL